jgi:hypothetical protein
MDVCLWESYILVGEAGRERSQGGDASKPRSDISDTKRVAASEASKRSLISLTLDDVKGNSKYFVLWSNGVWNSMWNRPKASKTMVSPNCTLWTLWSSNDWETITLYGKDFMISYLLFYTIRTRTGHRTNRSIFQSPLENIPLPPPPPKLLLIFMLLQL